MSQPELARLATWILQTVYSMGYADVTAGSLLEYSPRTAQAWIASDLARRAHCLVTELDRYTYRFYPDPTRLPESDVPDQ